ncbi:MAG TPA: dihydrolipoamide acetyltransferase family protein [Jatrophihabitans sp.]|uniref:dihydrolipoamide acetyltransferase family protein n=1 Tax=Jatrophihabitans sp. TaxID=1932789 RepID=UPI002DFC25A6|nr:dihydrolipoamide acetyltransferase family protein [Jatrophihabitans sp.]
MADFRMPSLGADMESGTLLEWLVGPGDPVHRGEVVAVIDTDKAAIEVECFDEGVIQELKVQPGERVPVGAVLASIDGAGAAVPPSGSAAVPPSVPVAPSMVEPVHVLSPLVRREAVALGVDLAEVGTGHDGLVHRVDVEHAAAQRARPAGPPQGGRVRASPLARRLAASAGVDLAAISGSGAGGVIVAADIGPGPSAPPPSAPPSPAPPARAPEHGTSMRQAIAALMARSKREIPHYYLTHTMDVSATLDRVRRRNRELPVEQRLVPAAFLLAATARALEAVPELNGTWVGGAFVPSARVDIGVVVSLRSGGIIVPVIGDAAALSAEQLMPVMRGLAARARNGRLRGTELAPPSITVTNLGDQGVDSVLGVIYPPQVAVVGFGAVADRRAVDGLLGVRPVVTVTVAADHRASDGAIGARLLNRIERLLHEPQKL